MNRLADETSPYLRQHAANPVDWMPWGDEAFALARELGKPVFVSIGYSACHWCHVMAHESFEDPATAALLNDAFVNVKVDREERPDVDAVYMQATQALTGHGGWPMSVWLLPDGRPFHAGTYFPPADRPGLPSFRRVCEAVLDAFRNRPDEVAHAAAGLTDALGGQLPDAGDDGVDAAQLANAVDTLWDQFDHADGGFGGAPKFPAAATLGFLARRQARHPDARVREMLMTTLDAMAGGGIYDHVGGGFARYSVDAQWTIPHFEKMLYDNAQLVRAYTAAWLVTGAPRYRRIVHETIEYVLRDLAHADGGFFSARDADSEGVEGKYYGWQRAEIRAITGDDADALLEHFDVTDAGNFVDPHTGFRANILRVIDRTHEPDAAVVRGLTALRAVRDERVPPGLDDKVLLEWNALMNRALAEAGAAFDRDDWIARARTGAEFCLAQLRHADGRLLRSWHADATPRPGYGRDGRGRHLAYAHDYAAFADALVSLGEYDDVRWFAAAHDLLDDLLARYGTDEGAGLYTTAHDAERLIVRPRESLDDATPAADSVAANAAARLAAVYGDDRLAGWARATIARVAPFFARHPSAFGHAMEAAERLCEPGPEIAIVGPRADDRTRALRRAVTRRLVPAAVLAVAPGDGETHGLALLDGRAALPATGAPTAYVCEHFVCQAPVTEPDDLAALLSR